MNVDPFAVGLVVLAVITTGVSFVISLPKQDWVSKLFKRRVDKTHAYTTTEARETVWGEDMRLRTKSASVVDRGGQLGARFQNVYSELQDHQRLQMPAGRMNTRSFQRAPLPQPRAVKIADYEHGDAWITECSLDGSGFAIEGVVGIEEGRQLVVHIGSEMVLVSVANVDPEAKRLGVEVLSGNRGRVCDVLFYRAAA